jgi:integrase
LSLADARERAGRYRVSVKDGADPQGERRTKKAEALSKISFGVLAQRYLDEYAKPRKKSWRNDEGYLNRPCTAWGARPADSITRRDAIALLDTIKQTAPISANRTQTVLVKLFSWAVEDELIEVNPIAGLKKRALEQAKDRTLADEELRALWCALDNSTGLTDEIASALKFLLLTGQRPGEVAGITRSELVALDRPAEARWELSAARAKTGRIHVTPLAPMARAVVEDALRRREKDGDGQSVFASKFVTRVSLARHSLSQGLRRLIQRLQVDGDASPVRTLQAAPPTPHDFRRTVGTGLARLGIPREDRMAVLGHIQDDVHGRHYDQYQRLREKRIALVAWEDHVAEVLGERAPAAETLPSMRGYT